MITLLPVVQEDMEEESEVVMEVDLEEDTEVATEAVVEAAVAMAVTVDGIRTLEQRSSTAKSASIVLMP